MAQYLLQVHGTARRSCGTLKRGGCKESRSIVVQQSPAFGIHPLADCLPSQQTRIFKYESRRGILDLRTATKKKDAFQSSRLTQPSKEHTTCHSRGHPMAHAFSPGALSLIP